MPSHAVIFARFRYFSISKRLYHLIPVVNKTVSPGILLMLVSFKCSPGGFHVHLLNSGLVH